jgi:Fe-Mn family superoxide dismutase
MRIPKKKLRLPSLPYHYDGLEPITSSQALRVHYEGHHAGYVKNFNKLLDEGGSRPDLEFNYSGHILHTHYWESFGPQESYPGVETQQMLDPEAFVRSLVNTALKIKGSGWSVAVLDRGQVKIMPIANHDLRNIVHFEPLLVLDAWEHNYYLDFANMKKKFFNSIVELINWDTLEKRLASSLPSQS